MDNSKQPVLEKQETRTFLMMRSFVNSCGLLIDARMRNLGIDHILFIERSRDSFSTLDFIFELNTWLINKGFPSITVLRSGRTYPTTDEYLEKMCFSRRGVKLSDISTNEKMLLSRKKDEKFEIHHPLLDWEWDSDQCITKISTSDLPVNIKEHLMRVFFEKPL